MGDWIIWRAYSDPDLQFERIAQPGALCIECKACGRLSALTAENCPHIRPTRRWSRQ